jgi:Transposase
MMIIGCDFHPSWQQISWLDTETGDCGEQKLVHAGGDAKLFYQQLAAPVLIGMEATGNGQWFVELVEDMGHEIWIGDAAQIRASYVRKQKTDKRDAAHILKLVVEGRFPRLWSPDREQRDLRQLVLHTGRGEAPHRDRHSRPRHYRSRQHRRAHPNAGPSPAASTRYTAGRRGGGLLAGGEVLGRSTETGFPAVSPEG